jgi:hypothetical protein
MPMENMKVPHTFREEWLKSRYSTAENYMPYEQYYALRVRTEPNQNYLQAKAANKDAKKTLAESKKAVKRSVQR